LILVRLVVGIVANESASQSRMVFDRNSIEKRDYWITVLRGLFAESVAQIESTSRRKPRLRLQAQEDISNTYP
jgi:hypothetical protein